MKDLARVAVCLVALVGAALAETSAPEPPLTATVARPGIVYVAALRNGFSMRFDHRQIIQETSRLFVAAGDDSFIDVATADIVSLSEEEVPVPPPPLPATAPGPPAATNLKAVVAAASDKHLVDADLIDSVIRAESGFNPKAVSRKGARGLMQLMPDTAAKLGVRDSFDSQANVDGGTRYLRELLARYDNDLAKALAAYNAGPQRVEQYHGVPPYHETRAYVASVIRDFNRKKLATRKKQPKKTAPAKPVPSKVEGSPPAATRTAASPVPSS
jgi:hypothetical protein